MYYLTEPHIPPRLGMAVLRGTASYRASLGLLLLALPDIHPLFPTQYSCHPLCSRQHSVLLACGSWQSWQHHQFCNKAVLCTGISILITGQYLLNVISTCNDQFSVLSKLLMTYSGCMYVLSLLSPQDLVLKARQPSSSRSNKQTVHA